MQDKPLRILMIVNIYPPDQAGGAVLFRDLAQGLTEKGHQVTVRTTYPYYPEWRDKSGQNGFRIRKAQDGAVALERYGLYIPRNPNSVLERMFYEGGFFLSLLRSLFRSRQFDVVFAACPLVGAVGFAASVRALWRIPVWLNVHDLSTQAAATSGILKEGFATRAFNAVQTFVFNRAQAWNTLAPMMVRDLRPLLHGNQPLFCIPNWLHKTIQTQLNVYTQKPAPLADQPLKLMYSGNIGSKQGLLEFCQTLSKSPAHFRFEIHGSGAASSQVADWVRSSGDARFSFGGLLEETEFVRGLYEADFFVITEKSGVGGSFIPSKMIPSFAVGTPVLGVSDDESPFGQEMAASGAGFRRTWAQVHELVEFIEASPQHSPEMRQWQEKARTWSRRYHRDAIIQAYDEGLRQLANRQTVALSSPEYHA